MRTICVEILRLAPQALPAFTHHPDPASNVAPTVVCLLLLTNRAARSVPYPISRLRKRWKPFRGL